MSDTARTDDLSGEPGADATPLADLTSAGAEGGLSIIADMVLEVARTDPQRVVVSHTRKGRGGTLVHEERTYGELSDRAERLAVGLRAAGVREGTLCNYMVPPSFDAIVLGVALFRIGAKLVGIEPFSHGLRRVTTCLARVGPEVFFGSPRAHLAKRVFGWGKATVRQQFVVDGSWPGVQSLDDVMADTAPAEPITPDVHPSDEAVIAFTTGSTGMPKPTVLRHRNFTEMVRIVKEQWGLADDGSVVDMPTFPMFWIIALSCGGQVVVPPMDFTMKGPGDADPALLLRTIEERDVTSMFASPALLTNLARHAENEGITIPSVRRIVAGGAEILGPLYAAIKDVLSPEGELYSNYGATEALPLCEIDGTTVLGETWERTERGEGLCVGWPLPGVELRIVATSTDTIPGLEDAEELPLGEVGEVIASSPHISEDYYRDPESTTKNKIRGEGGAVWHRLGDVGWLDDQGRLWLGGRVSHRVLTEERIYLPLQVEPVVATHPAVRKAGLVGVPREGRTVPTVCIERDEGDKRSAEVVADELRELMEQHDATRGIRAVVEVRKLPVDKRHNAKIDRPGPATWLARDLARPHAKGGRGRGGVCASGLGG